MLPSVRTKKAFLFPAFLWLLSCLEEDSLLCRLLDRKCFRHAGKLSLAVYCNHAFVIRLLDTQIVPRLEGLGLAMSAPIKAGLLLIVLTGYSCFTLWLIFKISKR